MKNNTILILGAGQAGMQAAFSLRNNGYEGKISLTSNENLLPYHRPPLSKAYLSGRMDEAALWFKPEHLYKDWNIDLDLNQTALAIDRKNKQVSFASGKQKHYDILIIATGANAYIPKTIGNTLLAPYKDHILSLRNLSDSKKLKKKLREIQSLTILGGGYIGLEIASIARKKRLNVSIIEQAKQILSRTASHELADFLVQFHQSQNVQFYLETHLSDLKLDLKLDSRQLILSLSGAHQIELKTDLLFLGIGAHLNIELAKQAGLDCERGILTDQTGKTSDSSIYAIGDVSQSSSPYFSGKQCLESIPNALESAKRTAAAITNKHSPPYSPPWFWSDQYDLKIQSIGLATETESVYSIQQASHLIKNPLQQNNLQSKQANAFLHFKNNLLKGCETINRSDIFMGIKQVLTRQLKIKKQNLMTDSNSIIKVLKDHLQK